MANKRRNGQKAVALGLLLCLALGGAAGLAEDMQQTALESAMERLTQAESMTVDAQVVVRQNGEDLITGEALCQTGADGQYASATITRVGGETKDMEMSVAGGTRVVRMGDDFYSMPMEVEAEDEVSGEADAFALSERTMGYASTVMTQLFGTVTEKMTVTTDGISLHLAGEEVPAILNLAVSLTDSLPTQTESSILYGTRGEAAQSDAPEALSLGSSLRIDRIDMDVAMEGELISGIQFTIVLAGEDAEGEAMETELAAVIRIYDVDATQPATVDMTGVDMKPFTSPHRGAGSSR